MNGRQLAEVVQQSKPNLPVLFLTGYAESAIKREDFLGPQMHLLTKPVSLEALAARIAHIFSQDAEIEAGV
jgi:CheY-like chemotaxis protein